MRIAALEVSKRCMLSAMACLLSIVYCTPAVRVEYYRHLRDYKIHGLTFSYPVDPKVHMKVNCYEVRYDDNNRITSTTYLKNGQPAGDPVDGLSRVEIEYSQNREVRYVKDVDGHSIYGDIEYFLYELNNAGKVISITNYSASNEIIEDTSGVARYAYVNDSLLNEVSEFRIDIEGDTIMDFNLRYKVVYELDELNNIVEKSNYDKCDSLRQDIDGIAIVRYGYNENDDLIDYYLYDENDQRTSHKEDGWSRVTHHFDENGNITRVERKDEEDNLVFNYDGLFAYYEIGYAESGDAIEILGYDVDGNPTTISRVNESGEVYERVTYARYKFLKTFRFEEYNYQVDRYDSAGRVVETEYFDTDGRPFYAERGYVGVRNRYDEQGNRVEQVYYSEEGNTVEDRYTGIAIQRYRYDDQGDVTEMAFYSVDGDAVEDRSTGIAFFRYKYVESGKPSEITTYGLDGRLKEDRNSGIAKTVYRQLDDSLSFETLFFNEEEKPTLFAGCSCYRMVMDSDKENDRVTLSYYGKGNQLVFNKHEGYSFSITEFNGKGFSTKTSYFDVDSSLIVNELLGYAIIEEDTHDGKTIETRYYDADGNLIDHPSR